MPAPLVHLKIKIPVTVRSGISNRSHEKIGDCEQSRRVFKQYLIVKQRWRRWSLFADDQNKLFQNWWMVLAHSHPLYDSWTFLMDLSSGNIAYLENYNKKIIINITFSCSDKISWLRISFKASAADELARRQASEVHHSEDFYHPWGLPKGNFKHRMISTGKHAQHREKRIWSWPVGSKWIL